MPKIHGQEFYSTKPERSEKKRMSEIPPAMQKAAKERSAECRGLFEWLVASTGIDRQTLLGIIAQTANNTPIEIVTGFLDGTKIVSPNIVDLIERQLNRFTKNPKELTNNP